MDQVKAESEATLGPSGPVRAEVDQIVAELQRALGAQCVSLLLYGGLTKGEFVPEASDINLMLVVDRVSLELLDQVAPLVQRGVGRAPVGLLLLTEEDLRRSTDVFPTKFLDIQRHHQILAGKDVFAGLEIGRDHLRLRCEQELKNLMLRLRQFYLERSRRPELLEATLQHAVSSLLLSLGVLAELKTGVPSDTKQAALAAAEQMGLSGQVLRQAMALKRGEYRPDAGELNQLYAAFMAAVEAAARMADEL